MFYNGAEIEFKVEEFDADEIVSKDFEKLLLLDLKKKIKIIIKLIKKMN